VHEKAAGRTGRDPDSRRVALAVVADQAPRHVNSAPSKEMIFQGSTIRAKSTAYFSIPLRYQVP
jgi:hypothetical protein